MEISVSTDIEQAIKKLQTFTEMRQLNFAVAKALTVTAYQAQAEVKRNMPDRFTIRRPWVLQGIKVIAATKDKLEAVVYSRDQFMTLQEFGGTKNPLGSYLAIPTSLVKRTKKDLVKAADKPKALGDKVGIIEVQGHKFLALKKARKGDNGQKLKLLYLLVPRAQIHERLGLNKDGQKIVRQNFTKNLQESLDFAIRTAR